MMDFFRFFFWLSSYFGSSFGLGLHNLSLILSQHVRGLGSSTITSFYGVCFIVGRLGTLTDSIGTIAGEHTEFVFSRSISTKNYDRVLY